VPKLACLAVLRCTLLEGLEPARAAAEVQEIAWQGRAAIWVVLVPEHWTRAASLKRPFEKRRQMPLPNNAAKRNMIA
jgi:hypothetical protein